MDLSKTPWNVQKNYESATAKEFAAAEMRARQRGDPLPRTYRLQAPGEEVMLQNMRHHEGMNGLRGEVLGFVADDEGFIIVNVHLANGAAKKMKIQPRCLKPIRHEFDSRPRGARLQIFKDMQFGLDADLAQSVYSGSRPTTALSAAAVLSIAKEQAVLPATPQTAGSVSMMSPRASTPRGATPRALTPRATTPKGTTPMLGTSRMTTPRLGTPRSEMQAILEY
eukprot:TRINITY_DN66717_c0_g1_i1.p1 TRINITY_DN66717_c0_g1~~TRINITY_DN66717_c0_g1_i1.p1  ORF type:complete len:224 (+),score=43.24 TRINITY_DN66717_c0_g1_i1:66-737(+)